MSPSCQSIDDLTSLIPEANPRAQHFDRDGVDGTSFADDGETVQAGPVEDSLQFGRTLYVRLEGAAPISPAPAARKIAQRLRRFSPMAAWLSSPRIGHERPSPFRSIQACEQFVERSTLRISSRTAEFPTPVVPDTISTGIAESLCMRESWLKRKRRSVAFARGLPSRTLHGSVVANSPPAAFSHGRIAMHRSPARVITAIIVAATGIYLGVKLAAYAEADDAPGGVVIGVIIMLGSMALGTWIALRRTRTPSSNDG